MMVVSSSTAADLGTGGPVEVVQTTDDLSQQMTRLPDLTFSAPPLPRGRTIHVNDRIRHQRIDGFGAAMTDASAFVLSRRLSPAVRAATLQSLFGAAGIHLSFLRLPIGASDFTRGGRPYSYDDLPPGRSDSSLSRFSIAHDRAYVLPTLKEVLAVNPGVSILATPWSPPGWMKTNDSLNNRRHRGRLRRSAYGTLARYFVKFIRGYAREHVPISWITPQNEPTNPTIYPGLELTASEEARFIVRQLVPRLAAAGLHPKIFGHDGGWTWPRSRRYAAPLASGRVGRQLGGIAWHCYFGDPRSMARIHRLAPNLEQIVSECAPEIIHESVSEIVIASLRNAAHAVAVWAVALNERGGPVQPPNHGCPGCRGVVTVDRRTGSVSYGRVFFQLGQASAFVQRGATRIESNHFVSYRYTRPGRGWARGGVDDVAFRNPDGSIVLMAYNVGRHTEQFAVEWRGHYFTYTLAPRATVTFVWHDVSP